MTLFLRKTAAIAKVELDTLEAQLTELLASKVNFERLDKQVDQLIEAKIEDICFQRFKDWTIPDLLNLKLALAEKLEAERQSITDRRSKSK